jgi:diacylglycerol kinase (ATP)
MSTSREAPMAPLGARDEATPGLEEPPRPAGVARRALIVVNPAAGATTDELVERLTAACGEHLDHVAIARPASHAATTRATAAAVARAARSEDGVDLVLSVGGDATACAVAEGIVRGSGRWTAREAVGSAPTLLPIPAGRGNSAYRALCDDAPWEDVLLAALEGDGARTRALDLLRIESIDRASLLGLNVGLLARIVRLAADEPATGSPLERYAAVTGDVLERFRPFPGRVTVDGSRIADGPLTQVTVGGVRRFAGGVLEILPRSVLDDGKLDVCVIGEMSEQGFAEVGALLPAGAHIDLPNVTYAQGRRVVVERCDGAALELEHDGDAWSRPSSSVAIEMLPRVLPVVGAPGADIAGGGIGLYA